MKLVTWNTAGRKKKQPLQAEHIMSLSTDIIALQEIKRSTHDLWVNSLIGAGLHVASSIDHCHQALNGPRNNFVLLASRHKITKKKQANLVWPEKALCCTIPFFNNLTVTTIHIPPGASNGWKKIETFEGIFDYLSLSDFGTSILCGDFNSPQKELEDGTLVTWGQKIGQDGTIRLARSKDQGSRWHDGEYNLLKGLEKYGYVDNYRMINGYDSTDYSWYVNNGDRVGRRFDHILSRGLEVQMCYYDHSVRENKLSDHSLMVSLWSSY
jgi:exonuclease III